MFEGDQLKSNKSRTVVVVENVTFCFPDSSLPLMQNMSARFPAGLNAIIGPSGVGKSTVVNIILGFIRPNSGSVYFLSESGSRIASPKISLVPQSPHIFFGGVVQNISLGLPLSPGDTEYIYNLLLECNLDSLHLDTLLSLPYEIQYENLLNLRGG
jgi:ABC-type bacteriocin/lantibiotic exporter with double-glycine peptidase domain